MDETPINATGHLKLYDPVTNETLVDKDNAIHFGNLTLALAQSIVGEPESFIKFVVFGNGGSIVEPSGEILYKAPNVSSVQDAEASLYNTTYFKELTTGEQNIDESNHAVAVSGASNFADVVVTATLDFGEPTGQAEIDQFNPFEDDDFEGDFVFDEIALYTGSTAGTLGPPVDFNPDGRMLTHVIFHPQQKALNRTIAIEYTLRIQIGE